MISLDRVEENGIARVVDIQGGWGIRGRLGQMGIHPGDLLTVRRCGALGGPILIGGSVLLALMEYGGVEKSINLILSPLTGLLGLPESVGTTLIFGLLRKELSLIMLTQALGTTEVLTVMTRTQVLVFTVFVTFYIPCLATIAALWREIGKKGALWAVLFTLSVATGLALLTRVFMEIFA